MGANLVHELLVCGARVPEADWHVSVVIVAMVRHERDFRRI